MSERLSITKNGAKLNEAINKTLEEIKASGTFKEERVITSKQAAEIAVEGREEKVLNFCANNYLGLANSPELIQAAKESLDSHGFGLASVRFICGTTDIHKQLEALIAKFHGMEDCILYSSCFDANGGFFEALFNAEDAVISDQLNHASIIDGIRLCKAQRHRYNHMDMQHLEKILQETQNCRYRCIVTDGVFSMDGDVAPLDRLVDLKAEARRVINAVSDPDQQLILELRYLCYKPWNEIMTELGYSEPTIYRLHGEALKKICVPVKNDSF